MHIQNKNQNESGGIILGWVSNENDNNVYVTKLSLPTNYDKSARCTFERDKHIAKIITDYEFYNSNGKLIYLGEWHTHPEANPSPSFADTKMIKQQYKDNKINVDFLILFIQGTKNLYAGLYNGNHIIDK
jgi:integrative and conjugative element protein (TIGR02256 family)